MKKRIISIALVLVVILSISALPAFAAGAISLDKTNYAPNEKITVIASGITEQMIKDRVFVSVYKAGAGDGDWGEYHRPQAATDTLTFTAPANIGSYEMRLYSADPGGRNAADFVGLFVTAVPFTVGATASQPTQQMPAATQEPTSGIKVLLDGKALTFDVPPQLINNRTMVPLRAIFEAMGAKVDWNGDTQTVTGTKDSTVVILKIGDTSPTINGKVVTIDQPGVIIDGRTLAPLRFVAEAFGGDVAWDGNTQTASISMGGAAATTPPATTPEPTPTPTPTPTQPPETTQPPSGNNSLVGVWVPRPEYALDYAGGIEFKADGTFFYRYNLTGVGFGTQKGNYKIQGDRIICTNVVESWEEYGYQGRNYSNEAVDDLTWPFYFQSTAGDKVLDEFYPNTTWLIIKLDYNTDTMPNKEYMFALSTAK